MEIRLSEVRIGVAKVRDIAEQYMELDDRVLLDTAGLLEGVDADAEAYRREVRERLPEWATGKPA